MNTPNQRPIGVFDSGVGGLTNVRALMERLPLENIVYFGDTARVPYGVKSRATIETFTAQIVGFMLEHDVKALVIACNTIAAVAGHKVRQMAGNMPVLDVISAGAQAALSTTRNNHIGVIATNTTVNSNAYAREIHRRNPAARVQSQACPLFVPLVEEGWLDHEVTRLTAREYLKPLLQQEAPQLQLVDSALTTAEAVSQALQAEGLLNDGTGQTADYRFYVSDIPLRFQTIGERFLGRSLQQIEMVSLG